MNGLGTGGPGYVAVGQGPLGAVVWISKTGARWIRVRDTDAMHRGAMRALVSTPSGRLVAVGDAIWTASPQGLVWKAAGSPSLQAPILRAVVRLGDRIVAVGDDRLGGTAALVSGDGVTWTAAEPQDGLANVGIGPLAVDATGSMVVAAGEDATGNGAIRQTPPE